MIYLCCSSEQQISLQNTEVALNANGSRMWEHRFLQEQKPVINKSVCNMPWQGSLSECEEVQILTIIVLPGLFSEEYLELLKVTPPQLPSSGLTETPDCGILLSQNQKCIDSYIIDFLGWAAFIYAQIRHCLSICSKQDFVLTGNTCLNSEIH